MPAVDTPPQPPAAPALTGATPAAPNGTDADPTDPGALRALTGEEQRLYDRQIRLWGVEAQRRLSTASILILGDVRTPAVQELAKNVVLTGIARLTLHTPPALAAPAPTPSPFPALLGADAPAVVASLQAMNCLVRVSVAAEHPAVGDATVVCAVGLARAAETALSDSCRAAKVPLLCGRVAGAVGWFFVDDSARRADDPARAPAASYAEAVRARWGGETRRSEFGWHTAQTILAFEDAHKRLPGGSKDDVAAVLELYTRLRSERGAAHFKVETVVAAARSAATSLPPVAAIVAGMWGRETIKLVSGGKQPIDNFFFFNAATSTGSVEKIGAK